MGRKTIMLKGSICFISRSLLRLLACLPFCPNHLKVSILRSLYMYERNIEGIKFYVNQFLIIMMTIEFIEFKLFRIRIFMVPTSIIAMPTQSPPPSYYPIIYGSYCTCYHYQYLFTYTCMCVARFVIIITHFTCYLYLVYCFCDTPFILLLFSFMCNNFYIHFLFSNCTLFFFIFYC